MTPLASRLVLRVVRMRGEAMMMQRLFVLFAFAGFAAATLVTWFGMVLRGVSVRPCSLFMLLLHGHKFLLQSTRFLL